MLRKVFGVAIILVALVLAVFGIFLPREQLKWVVLITNFFDIMIPALAAGALINYLWKSATCCHKDEE